MKSLDMMKFRSEFRSEFRWICRSGI